MFLLIIGAILFLYSLKVSSIFLFIVSCLLVLIGFIQINLGIGSGSGGFDFDD